METEEGKLQSLSPWWRYGVVLTIIIGLAVLVFMSSTAYMNAPPIPEKVVEPAGEVLFTGKDILSGQEVFLKYGLMENGTVWGHGAYLGPDFSAEYLHTLALECCELISEKIYRRPLNELLDDERGAVNATAAEILKKNRYDPKTKTLSFTLPEVASYEKQIEKWAKYFSGPAGNGGLPIKYIDNREELRRLTAFFAWTAWASVANRPGALYSYTNNFPYDPMVGNTLTSDAVIWSALSLISLLAATALVLLAFGRFDYLGWKGEVGAAHIHPLMIPGTATESQKATIKYFLLVSLLFLAQVICFGSSSSTGRSHRQERIPNDAKSPLFSCTQPSRSLCSISLPSSLAAPRTTP